MHRSIRNCIAVVITLISSLMVTGMIVSAHSAPLADETQQQERADLEAIEIFRILLPPIDEAKQQQINASNCTINNEWTHFAIPNKLAEKYLSATVRGDLVSPADATAPKDIFNKILKEDSRCKISALKKLGDYALPKTSESSKRQNYDSYDFSYPIFNYGYKKALVVLSFYGFSLYWTGNTWERGDAGGGHVLFFEKKNGHWKQTAKEELWIE